ncbi:DUF3482 domain-containing protein [Paenalcaligenes niemegkensis]|uniref:GTPase/DUF3482 domain-containing protein n=1 Tax=Paenalcaligenes niemegkensis TaxID=2895469 RepID=UPI001EE8B32B|nr:GTPase/DUF3482 domain-containing protein [Paenalcaligenes niemegkensis]MCQ9618037.1 DUF3482 domain-containing protein [Paenalcaligenes niemegkensis]
MNSENIALRLAVVGHTNTGKTSLLRTLTRDAHFGEVRNSPGTTRHVEGVRLKVEDTPVVELFDTPGIEDSMALLEYLERLILPGERIDGPASLGRFLETPEALGRFEQEARVVRQLLASDAGLYVVDVRDPVLAKHQDELRILSRTGKPLLPVLNFTRSAEQRIDEWRTALANVGLHAIAEFDTVAPALGGEAQLYERLALLLNEGHSAALKALISNVQQQRSQRLSDAWRILADMLVDVTAWRLISEADENSISASTRQMREQIRQREERCVKALLKRFNFSSRDYLPDELQLDGTRWETDLFNPEALRNLGVQMSKGVAAGALAGATVDMLTLGFSLGAGTVVGAAAGGLWQGFDKWGQRLMGKWRGKMELSVDESVIRVLALRQATLIRALEARGHAAQTPIAIAVSLSSDESDSEDVNAQTLDWRKGPLPAALLEARGHPEWSSMLSQYGASPRREQVVVALATVMNQPAPNLEAASSAF